MQLEEYFDFIAPDQIRLKGRRIGIEHVLYHHIHEQMTPEEIAEQFDQVSLEQIHAVILYYLANSARVTRYLEEWIEGYWKVREEARQKDPEFYEHWAKIKAEWLKRKSQESA